MLLAGSPPMGHCHGYTQWQGPIFHSIYHLRETTTIYVSEFKSSGKGYNCHNLGQFSIPGQISFGPGSQNGMTGSTWATHVQINYSDIRIN